MAACSCAKTARNTSGREAAAIGRDLQRIRLDRCGILALMLMFRTRGRRWGLAAIAAVLFAILAALLLKPMLEQAVRARIEAAAVSRGMVARIGQVHVGVWPFVRLERFDLDAGHGLQLHADA